MIAYRPAYLYFRWIMVITSLSFVTIFRVHQTMLISSPLIDDHDLLLPHPPLSPAAERNHFGKVFDSSISPTSALNWNATLFQLSSSLGHSLNTNIKNHSITTNSTTINFGGPTTESSSTSSSSSTITIGSSPTLQPNNYQIVWLISFPNSGTSYTLQHIRTSTKVVMATNYAKESLPPTVKDNKNTPPLYVFPKETNGPYWLHGIVGTEERYPEQYVLTKTHCTLYNRGCLDACWLEQLAHFSSFCLGSVMKPAHSSKQEIDNSPSSKLKLQEQEVELGTYPSDYVAKAIHLVRDPFENVVSRFHNRMITGTQLGTSSETRYVHNQNDQEQFRAYCKKEQLQSPLLLSLSIQRPTNISSYAWTMFRKVPCRDDFFRYIIWHNMVFETTSAMRLDTMIFHYESFGTYNSTEFHQASNRLHSFLNYTPIASSEKYERVPYVDYFTDKEKRAVYRVVKEFASQPTWNAIKRYFMGKEYKGINTTTKRTN